MEIKKVNVKIKENIILSILTILQGGHRPGKPGILRDFSEHGNSVQPQRKILTNKVFLVRHSNICVKQLLTG